MAVPLRDDMDRAKALIEKLISEGKLVPEALVKMYEEWMYRYHVDPPIIFKPGSTILFTPFHEEHIIGRAFDYSVSDDFITEEEPTEDKAAILERYRKLGEAMPKIDALDGLTEKQKRAIVVATQGYREIIGKLVACIVDPTMRDFEITKTHEGPDGYCITIPHRDLAGKRFNVAAKISYHMDMDVEQIEIQYE